MTIERIEASFAVIPPKIDVIRVTEEGKDDPGIEIDQDYFTLEEIKILISALQLIVGYYEESDTLGKFTTPVE